MYKAKQRRRILKQKINKRRYNNINKAIKLVSKEIKKNKSNKSSNKKREKPKGMWGELY